jgi:predicted SnoaL-like aldol condensation-catalyzing enzyme
MKKSFLIIAAGTLMLASCGSKKESGGMSDAASKNLETNHAILKMFEGGDWSKTGDYIAADAVDHAGENGDVKGLDSIKATFDRMGGMMGEMKNDIVKELADDDYVMCWVNQHAVSKVDAPEWGMKKGQAMDINSIEVSKYNKDHKVTEHWSFVNMHDMMKMMGGAGNPGANNMPMDTTHK